MRHVDASEFVELAPDRPLLPFDANAIRAVRSCYIHVPFCSHKCGYCDFASVAGSDDRMEAYLGALAAEIDGRIAAPIEVDTIFVGGGTPTYLEPKLLERLLQLITAAFPLSPNGEFTVESNPNTLTRQKVDALADAGVNRVSLGAQSFIPELLKALERDHDPASVPRAVEMVRKRIRNVSIDLIFGVPGQTLEQWRTDLETALELEPDHCSTYGLTYEKGTSLWRRLRAGGVAPVDEEIERQMYGLAIDRLSGEGWSQYEISNFARTGRECRHNLAYWNNDACLGFGLGAAAYVGGTRRLNTRELNAYLARCQSGRSPETQCETLGEEDRARETAMLALRLRKGIDRNAFHEKTGHEIDVLAGPALGRFIALGLVEDDGSSMRISREGLFVADSILRAVWE